MGTIIFAATTTTAVLGGQMFLMGTVAPVDSVRLDGTAVAFIVTAPAVDSVQPDQSVSVIVPMTPSVLIGYHDVRIRRGADEWDGELTVVAEALSRPSEQAMCIRHPHGPIGFTAYVWDRGPAGAVGLAIQDSRGTRVIAGSSFTQYFASQDGPVESKIAPKRIIQGIYRDGSVGARWEVECTQFQMQPSAEGFGIPLWLDTIVQSP